MAAEDGPPVVNEEEITFSLDDKAAQEWAEVERTQNERVAEPTDASASTTTLVPLEFEDAFSHFMKLDLTEYKKKIVTDEGRPKGFLSSVWSLFFSPPSLDKTLIQERDSIFAIALIAYDNNDAMHSKVLQNLYMTIKGVKVECPRFGPHWEEIGFQGDDPATDLRGVGMFGLLQVFYFVKKHYDLAMKIHKLSRDERQCFPFSVVSLNFTKLILQTARSGVLTSKFNKRKSVLTVMNELLVGLYYELYQHWKRGHRTISDFPPLLKELTDKCMKDPTKILDNYKQYQNSAEGQSSPSSDFVAL
jgi:hypothetical protein